MSGTQAPGPGRMSVTSVLSLAVAAVAAAVVVGALVWFFYGDFPPVKVSGSVTLWILAVVAALVAVVVRRRLRDNGIGMDRSQMAPVTVARAAVYGKACAWVGAVFGGAYVGVGFYVLLHHQDLAAAQADTPGAVAGLLAGAAACVAGVWLERSCLVPPSDGDSEKDRGRGRATGRDVGEGPLTANQSR
jgi:hypothetical protein